MTDVACENWCVTAREPKSNRTSEKAGERESSVSDRKRASEAVKAKGRESVRV